MRKFIAVLSAILGLAVLIAAPASAGSAHFIKKAFTFDRDGNSLTVSGKEAGLGDLEQVHIVVSVEAACLNMGGNFPQAANKETFSQDGDFPVQNGKADFTVTVTATFQPECSPPMTVVFGTVTVTDETNGVTAVFKNVA